MKVFFSFLFLSLFFLLTHSSPAQQEIIGFYVVPPAYTNTAGNGGFLGPLSNADRSYQLLIHEGLLTSLVGQEFLAISWRIVAGATANWPPIDANYSNYDIYLGESVPPANRSLVFAENRVGDQDLVRFGSLTIPAGSYTSGSSPNEWGPEIMFDDRWLYEGGHLLIEIRHTASGTTNQSTDALTASLPPAPGYGTDFSALWQSSYNPTSGSQGNFSIVRITHDDPIPVELTSFTASVIGSSVHLNWITASEINNYGFEVERKTNESNYEKIGFVTGAGSTTETQTYSYTDTRVTNGNYTYRLKQVDFDGSFEYSYEVEVDVNVPAIYALEQNYPNPFNPTTNINFSLAEAGNVKLLVYNLLGEEVMTIINELREAGRHSVTFDAGSLPSGTYFYKLETPQFSETKKMILAK
jgi:hypothetical protein